MRVEHILVPTDFGDSSSRAEALAIELAAKLGARVTLMHVWNVPAPSYAEALTWPVDKVEAAARESLAAAVARWKEKHPNVEGVLAAGYPSDCIVETAKTANVDMIVMGTHGRRGVSRILLGSVAEKVVRLAPVPVLTVGEAARG